MVVPIIFGIILIILGIGLISAPFWMIPNGAYYVDDFDEDEIGEHDA